MLSQPAGSVPRVKPAGQVSVKVTLWASEGPALLLRSEERRVGKEWRAVTLVTRSVLMIDRSALVVTVLESVAVLLPVLVSLVEELTVAELTCGLAVVLAGTV